MVSDIKCGQRVWGRGSFSGRDCHRPAVAVRTWLFRSKPADLAEYAIGDKFVCNFHLGVEKRRRGFDPEDFVGLDDPRIPPYVERMKKLAAVRDKEEKKKAEAIRQNRLEQSQRSNREAWEDYTAPVTSTWRDSKDDPYRGSREKLTWEVTPQSSRSHFDNREIEVDFRNPDADDPWFHIDPAYVSLRSTGTYTPAMAREIAHAMLAAADRAEEETERLAKVRAERMGK